MSRRKAILRLDARHWDTQYAYVTARAEVEHWSGDRPWVSLTDDQVPRFQEQGIGVDFPSDLSVIRTPATTFDPTGQIPVPPPSLAASPPSGSDRAYHIVHFAFPVDGSTMPALLETDAVFVQDYGAGAAIVSASAVERTAIEILSFVDWIGLFHPAYALAHELAGRGEPFSPGELAGLVVDPASIAAEAVRGLAIAFFDDVDAENRREMVEATGATITGAGANGFTLAKDAAVVPALLALPGVAEIMPIAQIQTQLNKSRQIVNVDVINRMENLQFLSGVEGSGERLGLVDNGLDHSNPASLGTLRQDINGRVLGIVNIVGGPLPPTGDHGTHVAGIMMGDGTTSNGKIRGMAPRAHVFAQVGIPFADDTVVVFVRAARNQVKAINNSWGAFAAGPSNNVYGATARNIDRFCYLYPEVLVVFASGNDEQDTGPGGGVAGAADGNLDMDRLSVEGRAKNILTVGASESLRKDDGLSATYRAIHSTRFNHANFNAVAGGKADGYTISDSANQVAMISARGPVNSAAGVATGRTVPALVAPGTNIIALRSSLQAAYGNWRDPNTVSAATYTIKFGTSMAAPHVTGAAVLCRQFYRTRFGQLRRPTVLDSVASESTPFEDFTSLPAAARVGDHHVLVWVRPESSANPKAMVGAILDAQMIAVHAAPLPLLNDVGEVASARLAVDGTALYVLHRHGDGELQLHRFTVDPAAATITTDAGWDGTGHVVVATGIDLDPARPPALTLAGGELGVAWFAGGTLSFRRYQAGDGSEVDTDAIAVGPGTGASPHVWLVHNGTRYAMAWLNNGRVVFNAVESDGSLGITPDALTVSANGTERAPVLVWDPTGRRHIVLWDAEDAARESILVRGVGDELALQFGEVTALSTAAGGHLRRPALMTHPETGFILVWEDDTRAGQFDVCFTFLDAGLHPDSRIPIDADDAAGRRLSLISDTPQDTSGFGAAAHEGGLVVGWNSLDEINTDTLTVAALGIRADGNLVAQSDPGTPMIVGGRYVNHGLGGRAIGSDVVAVAWAGGDLYRLGWESEEAMLGASSLLLRRLNADGLIDTGFGAGGSLPVSTDFFVSRAALHWDGRFLFCVTAGAAPEVRVFDNLGRPADGSNVPFAEFGNGGTVRIEELSLTQIAPQLGSIPQPPAPPNQFRVIVAYGEGFVTNVRIRYAVLDTNGDLVNLTGGAPADAVPIDLVTVAQPGEIGTARHGWFHHVAAETRSIAAWHERAALGQDWQVRIRQFDNNGAPFVPGAPPAPPPTALLARAAGDTWQALNACLASRQQGITGAGVGPHEYAIVWQHRPAAGQPFEIRFSRLDRVGTPVAATHDVQVIFPGMLGADGATAIWPPVAGTDTDALAPQIVCTHTNEDQNAPPAPPPPAAAVGNIWAQWAPGYGLAFLGQPAAGGNRGLYFTVLDENGARLQVDRPAPQGRATAEILKVSDDAADVRDFHLVWNGRSFRLAWSEERDGALHHMQTALTRHGSRNVYEQPSSALLRATLISGATNISSTALPNLPSAANRIDGYGWGRLNLRQSLAPPPPVTVQVRDDAAVGSGRTARYRFRLAPGTVLLRATLAWTDPPGPQVVNDLDLQVTSLADGRVYHGNQWDVAGGNPHLSRAVGAAGPTDTQQTVEQVVLSNPPAGEYLVEVTAGTISATADSAFPAQAYALAFVGSGIEDVFGVPPCDRDFY